jgi:hypothetical protein
VKLKKGVTIMKKIALFLMLLLTMGFVGVAQADLTLYYTYGGAYTGDPDAFLTACPDPLVENFEDTVLVPGFSITEIGGDGTIENGVYKNIVDNNPLRYQIFNYDSLYGFGGWFDLYNPGGPGTSIDMYINDNNTFVMNIPNTAAGQFYGFFSTDPFTGVRFEAGPESGVQETYWSVDVAMCPVPIPPAALLLASGLLGLIGIRRFRNRG